MKKVFILLGIILLNIMMSSCEKSEKEYTISKYNDEINKDFLSWEYFAIYEPPVSIKLSNMEDIYNNYDEIVFLDYSNDLNDYYTCGYLSIDIKDKLIDESNFWQLDDINSNYFVGKDYALVKYKNMINFTKKITFDDYPLVWYEIPKNDEIPEEINDKFLVCVLESKTVTYKRLDGSVKNVSEFFIEKQSLYPKENNEYSYLNSWAEEMLLAKDKYMFFENEDVNKDIVQLPNFKYDIRLLFMNIEVIDNAEYVCCWDEYSSEGVDLREEYEYILENGDYLFKLEDIIKILEEKKNKIN